MPFLTHPGKTLKHGWLILLWVSLGVNLFLLGMTASSFLRRPPGPPPIVPSPVFIIESILASLPPDVAEGARQEWAAQRRKIDGVIKEGESKRDAIKQAIRAEPYRQNDMRAALAAADADRRQMEEITNGFLITLMAKLPAGERQRIANLRMEPPRPGFLPGPPPGLMPGQGPMPGLGPMPGPGFPPDRPGPNP